MERTHGTSHGFTIVPWNFSWVSSSHDPWGDLSPTGYPMGRSMERVRAHGLDFWDNPCNDTVFMGRPLCPTGCSMGRSMASISSHGVPWEIFMGQPLRWYVSHRTTHGTTHDPWDVPWHGFVAMEWAYGTTHGTIWYPCFIPWKPCNDPWAVPWDTFVPMTRSVN